MKYSNCLIEALKAKIRNPQIKIKVYPLCLNNNHLHFYWVDKDTVYHFTCKNKFHRVLFKGELKKYDVKLFNGSLLYKMYQNISLEDAYKVVDKYHLHISKEEEQLYYEQENEY